MKDFTDRQPTQAGRRKITYADGNSEYVTVEMADEPTREGTPLNRDTFMEIQGYENYTTEIISSEKIKKTYPTGVEYITLSEDGTVLHTFTGDSGLTVSTSVELTKNGIVRRRL